MTTQWELVYKQIGPHLSRADMEKILRAVISETNAWEVAGRARVPFPLVVATLRALKQGGWMTDDANHFHLTASGVALANEFNLAPLPTLVCPHCGGSGVLGLEQQDFFKRFVEIFNSHPRGENPDFDQAPMTPASTARRLSWMIESGDVIGRQVAILGDDDLLSVALALSGMARSVTMLEIDPRLCEFISHVAATEHLDINVRQQDLCAFLPQDMLGRFDTFVTDPPEAEAGMLLFVKKGLALLKPGDGHAGYFGVTLIESSLGKWARWQKHLLNNYPIAIANILPPFTRYYNWASQEPVADLSPLRQRSQDPWYRSYLERIETLPEFTPPLDFSVEFSDAIYLDPDVYLSVAPGSVP
ncbi:MAG TPA: bis-aminopropyl spermidine synthase family protein [Anaerolineae bacterium]